MKGIGAKIGNNLMYFSGICKNQCFTNAYLQIERSSHGQGCPQQFNCFFDDKCSLDWITLSIRLTTEGQNLEHQFPSPVTGLEYLLQILCHLSILFSFAFCKLCKTHDGRKNIIKIMGNTTSQSADGLKLLGLLQFSGLFLNLLFQKRLIFFIFFNQPDVFQGSLSRIFKKAHVFDWFGYKIPGTELQGPDGITKSSHAGNNNHRSIGRFLLDGRKDFNAIYFRNTQIGKN